MRSLARSLGWAVSAAGAALLLPACTVFTTGHRAEPIVLDHSAEYQGKVVGPIVRGQPDDGTGFKSFELELGTAVVIDDKNLCGPQEVKRMPIEKDGMAQYLGKSVRLKAKAYCRTNKTGTYHLNEVIEVHVLS